VILQTFSQYSWINSEHLGRNLGRNFRIPWSDSSLPDSKRCRECPGRVSISKWPADLLRNAVWEFSGKPRTRRKNWLDGWDPRPTRTGVPSPPVPDCRPGRGRFRPTRGIPEFRTIQFSIRFETPGLIGIKVSVEIVKEIRQLSPS